MRSDREEIPEGFTKADADKAETMEAALAQKQTARSGVSLLVAPGCQVYWPAPYEVCGAIKDKYNSLGGPTSFLLLPTTNELTNPDGQGKRSVFQNGPIYWSAAGGAHPVVNHFFAAWARKGYEGGYIGYPTTDEIVNPDGIGRRQHFTGADIYWKLNEAYSIGGAIKTKWGQAGWEGGWLGYPSSDETVVGVGRMNRFENGFIYWSAAGGAHPISGPVFDKWAAAGYEGGTYGFPTADQTSTDGNVTVEQQFQRGKITVPGPIPFELARLNPGMTADAMLTEARERAALISASVIDVLQDQLTGIRLDLSLQNASEPLAGKAILPYARGAGDVFFADAATAKINHGHNGIFVSTTETVEALSPEKGVRLIDNTTAESDGSRRQVHGPKMMWINTSADVRARAVDFARAQVGKAYNSDFMNNKKRIADTKYNCSQIIWAAYMSASGSSIDLDDAGAGSQEGTASGIFPREIGRSKWVTPYP